MPGSRFWAIQGGTERITRSCGPSVSSPSSKVKPSTLSPPNRMARSGRPNRIVRPATPQPRNGGVDESGGEAWRCDERPYVAPAFRECFAHDGARKIGRGFLRRRVQGGQQHGPQEFVPQNTIAPNDFVDPPAGMTPQQGRAAPGSRAGRVPGTRRPGSRIHQGTAPSLGRRVQRWPDGRSKK